MRGLEWIAIVASGLILGCKSTPGAAFHESRTRGQPDAASESGECGDGDVGDDEECDPMAPEWQDLCDESCHRTAYATCASPEECPTLNANCTAYTKRPEQQQCADFCESDESCPVLPGFRSTCNFAWCAVLCEDGECPNGMTCVQKQTLVDYDGHPKGGAGVCVNAGYR